MCPNVSKCISSSRFLQRELYYRAVKRRVAQHLSSSLKNRKTRSAPSFSVGQALHWSFSAGWRMTPDLKRYFRILWGVIWHNFDTNRVQKQRFYVPTKFEFETEHLVQRAILLLCRVLRTHDGRRLHVALATKKESSPRHFNAPTSDAGDVFSWKHSSVSG